MEIIHQDGEIEQRPQSKGGKIFDVLTYGALNVVGTFLLTPPLANIFLKEGGKFHGVDVSLRNTLQKKGMTEKWRNTVSETLHTGWGGIVMVAPIMLLEHLRTPIVIGLNRKLGDPTDPESVKDAPPQTIKSAVQGRLVAAATAITAFSSIKAVMGENRFKGMLDKSGRALCKLLNRPVELVKDGKTVFSKTYDFGHTSALDLVATLAGAAVFYISSHAFARKAQEKKVYKAIHPEEQRGHKHQKNTSDLLPQEPPTAPTTSVNSISRDEQKAASAIAPAPDL